MSAMKDSTCRFVIWMGLLAVYLLPMGISAQMFQEDRHRPSGVIGRVIDAQGFNTSVAVSTDAGVPLTGVETDENGFFVMELQPGNYVLRAVAAPKPTPGGALPNYLILGPTIPVTVKKGRFTIVQLPIAVFQRTTSNAKPFRYSVSGIIGMTG